MVLDNEQIKRKLEEILINTEVELHATHSKLCFPIILRMYKKMIAGISFPSIKVYRNFIIIDGHHRYLASLLADVDLERVDSPTTSAKKITSWAEVELSMEDWDTQEKIEELNAEDAKYNNIPLEIIIELLK